MNIHTVAQWATKCQRDVASLAKLRDEDGDLRNYTSILDRFQRDSLYQSNQIVWGQTREFTDLSTMIWHNLGSHEPYLRNLGDSFMEHTAEAMDLAAQRPKEDNKMDRNARREIRERQEARGTGQVLKCTTPDGRSLPAQHHPQYLPVQTAERAAAAEAVAPYAQGSSSWSNYRSPARPTQNPAPSSSETTTSRGSNKIPEPERDPHDVHTMD